MPEERLELRRRRERRSCLRAARSAAASSSGRRRRVTVRPSLAIFTLTLTGGLLGCLAGPAMPEAEADVMLLFFVRRLREPEGRDGEAEMLSLLTAAAETDSPRGSRP